MYPLVLDLAADNIPVAVTCRVLGPQAFYAWRKRPVCRRDYDDAHLINAALDIHHDDPGFGYRFVADELTRPRRPGGPQPRPPTVQPAADLVGPHPQTGAEPQARPAGARRPRHPRVFTAPRPDQLLLTDITEHPTGQGTLYLCTIKDACSNRIVGYSMDARMTADLAVSALRSAVALRHPTATVVHSDRGSQGGFNWSSQHLVMEVSDGSTTAGSRPCDSSEAAPVARGRPAFGAQKSPVMMVAMLAGVV